MAKRIIPVYLDAHHELMLEHLKETWKEKTYSGTMKKLLRTIYALNTK